MIDARRVRDAAGWQDTRGRVQVLVAGSLAYPFVEEWTAGRRVEAPVMLRRLHVWRNPGGPSPRRQALARGLIVAGTIKSATLIEVAPGRWWHEAAAAVRGYVRRQTARWIAPIDPVSAAIVTAILIGDRAGLPLATTRRLQAAGTYHVIAISGGNVAVVMLIGIGAARLVFRSFRIGLGATLILVATYGWIVGGDPSVTRAIIAACVYLGCRAAGWSVSALDVLAVVILIALAADPLLVIDVGAWLSFGAVLGIILGSARIAAFLVALLPAARSAHNWTRQAPIALLSATVAVEVALLPVHASIFSRLGFAGLILNFIAIPAMAVVQLAGLALIAVGGWWEHAATGTAWVAHASVQALVRSAALVDVAPWTSWRVPPPPIWSVVAFYAATAGALLRGSPWRRWSGAAAALLAVVIATAPGLERRSPRAKWLRITMLDVGQAEAIAVQFPSGQSLLVDAGGVASGFDVGERVVVPALWALGVRRLDWLAFTHADLDHAGGTLAVAHILRPREVWEGIPVFRDERRQALREAARASGIGWRRLQAGDTIELGDVAVSVLHPAPPEWERQRVRNDDSLVMRVVYGDVEILLTGDIGGAVEAQLDAAVAPRRVRVLKVAHHGSRTSTSPDFVAGLRPHLAFVSAGRGNLFGHPAREVLARLDGVGATVFRTDRDGAVQLETDGRVVRIETMDGRRRWFSPWPSQPDVGGGEQQERKAAPAVRPSP
jgi:competence protein ComEC